MVFVNFDALKIFVYHKASDGRGWYDKYFD